MYGLAGRWEWWCWGFVARGFADVAATQPSGRCECASGNCASGETDKWGYNLFNPVPKDQDAADGDGSGRM